MTSGHFGIQAEEARGPDQTIKRLGTARTAFVGRTLRGPVNTDDEKRLIGEIANRIAPSGNADNQLEVKITTSSNN